MLEVTQKSETSHQQPLTHLITSINTATTASKRDGEVPVIQREWAETATKLQSDIIANPNQPTFLVAQFADHQASLDSDRQFIRTLFDELGINQQISLERLHEVVQDPQTPIRNIANLREAPSKWATPPVEACQNTDDQRKYLVTKAPNVPGLSLIIEGPGLGRRPGTDATKDHGHGINFHLAYSRE